MDAARLLYFKMYDPEGVEDFEQKLRSSCNYLQRLKSLYEEIMALSQEELHLRAKQSWNGRTSSLQTAALDLFTSQWVRPSLDCEPGVSMKHQHLKGLLAYMASETSSTSADLPSSSGGGHRTTQAPSCGARSSRSLRGEDPHVEQWLQHNAEQAPFLG